MRWRCRCTREGAEHRAIKRPLLRRVSRGRDGPLLAGFPLPRTSATVVSSHLRARCGFAIRLTLPRRLSKPVDRPGIHSARASSTGAVVLRSRKF